MTAFVPKSMPKKSVGPKPEPAEKEPKPKVALKGKSIDEQVSALEPKDDPLSGIGGMFQREENRAKNDKGKGLGQTDDTTLGSIGGMFRREENRAKNDKGTGLGQTDDTTLGSIGGMFRREENRAKNEEHKGLGQTDDNTLGSVSGMLRREEDRARNEQDKGLGKTDDDTLGSVSGMLRREEDRARNEQDKGLGKTSDEDLGATRSMLNREEQERIKAEAQKRRDKKVEDNKLKREQQEGQKTKVHGDRAKKVKPLSEQEKKRQDEIDEAERTKEERAQQWEKKVRETAELKARVLREQAQLAGPTLTEALRYSDEPLNTAHQTLQTAIAVENWAGAAEALRAVRQNLEAMKGHLAFFKTFEEKRLPWIRAKLGTDADEKLATTMSKVNGRYGHGRDGVAGVIRWLESNYMGAIERPETEAEFNAIKHDDGLASAKLDELLGHGVIRPGEIRAYRTSWDRSPEFSVEVTIQGIPKIVLHSHCNSDGSPKTTGNASHWKNKSSKYAPGSSHHVSSTFRDAFNDAGKNKAAARQAGV